MNLKNYTEIKRSSNGKYKKILTYRYNKLYLVENYKNDKLEGETIEYIYKENERKILKKDIYKNGVKHGVSKEYIYEINEVIYITYRNGKKIKEEYKTLLESNIDKYNKSIFEIIIKYLSKEEVNGFIILIFVILIFISIMKWLSIF
jgi:antitoxin component YwqK of YwqJK toxin-antitoxin module